MNILFNTNKPDTAASVFYSNALSGIDNISFNDNNYGLYDIALFMTYDHHEVRIIKKNIQIKK